ncbi:MAG: glycosyltransferase family 4 protein [bacterium]|nr:glycosyltransferase family 4 protein [bacterium]
MKSKLDQRIELTQPKVRSIYLSTYIPQKCGIATYTKDLTNAINVLNPYNLAEIMAVSDNGYDYPWEVKFRISQAKKEDYLAAADYINKSSAEIFCLQHEYGIFGGKDGELVLELLKRIKKPVVTTFHTVLKSPSPSQKKILKAVAARSNVVVVMIDTMVDRLTSLYDIPSEKIVVIPHGVPDIPYGPTQFYKKELGLENKFVVSVNNLLADNKGFEYLIEAIGKVKDKIPEIQTIIIGETHPIVKKFEGEKYRNFLESKVKQLKLENYVKFINRYVSLEELLSYLRATDVYVTPYLDSQAAASGALSYAVGAGKACISTPYIFAKEVLKDDRGVLVPFKNSDKVAAALLKIYREPKFRASIETKSYQHGRTMIWPAVALRYLDLYRLVLGESAAATARRVLTNIISPIYSRDKQN